MIFKGQRFRKSRKIVMLPGKYGSEHGVAFGRVCAPDAKDALDSGYHWKLYNPYTGVPKDKLFARRIKFYGYSLTNLMYGADGYMYLGLDGQCYVRKYKIPEIWKGREKK